MPLWPKEALASLPEPAGMEGLQAPYTHPRSLMGAQEEASETRFPGPV